MDDSTTMRVVSAVAEATGRDALDLPPLAEAVDADALEALVPEQDPGTGRDVGVEVRFSYAGREVTVEAGGDVTVAPAHADGNPRRTD